MNILETLVNALINAPTPLIGVLIFVVIICFLVYLLVSLAARPGEGYQILVTNLTGDYRVSNAQVIHLTQQLGEVKTKQARLEMEVSILTQRAATSDLQSRESKASLRETLDKLEMVMDELATVHRQLDEANKIVIVKDGRIAELETLTETLKSEIATLHKQVLDLQNAQTASIGEQKS